MIKTQKLVRNRSQHEQQQRIAFNLRKNMSHTRNIELTENMPLTRNLKHIDVSHKRQSFLMGKGIALEFRRRYPDMFEACQAIWAKHLLQPGHILPYTQHTPWILNVAIKNDWKNPSKIEWIESCLNLHATNLYMLTVGKKLF